MNIAFFLTPKSEVVYEDTKSTMRQVLERMEYHRYTAVPIIDDKGRYVGTITEGDLLWKLKNTPDMNIKETSNVKVTDIERRTINKPVSINADMESLISLAVNQNFVPVTDDNGIFIGIIKRSDIINYFYSYVANSEESMLSNSYAATYSK
ncbi:CBS domain-containing protein [Clostridium sp. YIM B02515]|uniref:CBS domain-containing protein n=1 Tax=Clostridium rhizosphaerae TaxID=2803861 RepID=A0ABS1T7Z3_9CLOT|nr:CBS domain-containing protein [Clostridium rhizosphaerae]MBL4935425.1 CBS domain-containing protein [Clostridium rhizosphaerae]